jgi:phosphoribosylanthranilate isomerase
MTALKICCIASVEEARLALQAGADALGLVSSMPSGPGVIEDDRITEIAAAVRAAPNPPRTFLLTSQRTAEGIAAQHARAGTTTLQLVDQVPFDELRALRRACPGVELVQVIHVVGEASLQEAVGVAPLVDALLLDSGNPALAVKELGGTGRTHDWQTSRAIVQAVSVPVFLAGGLRAHNVAEAVSRVGPHGVDLCTGVRSDGRLDAAKLAAFVTALRAARPQPGRTRG